MSPLSLSSESLQELEAAITAALASGDERRLTILGYGEISIVVAWSSSGVEMACKRLPPFSGAESLAAYRACVETYLARLARGGIEPLTTSVEGYRREEGEWIGYCLQPMLPGSDLLPHQLANADEERAIALFDLIVDRVQGCVTEELGLDGQISNWATFEGRMVYIDVSTPLMRDEAGHELLDTELFLSSLPWALRGLVRRFMLGAVLDKYYDVRGVVVDLLANLYKEELDHLVPPLLRRSNERLSSGITEDEVRRYYRSDARMWTFLQRLRRMDRFWQRRIRRRTYPFLLPRRIDRHLRTS